LPIEAAVTIRRDERPATGSKAAASFICTSPLAATAVRTEHRCHPYGPSETWPSLLALRVPDGTRYSSNVRPMLRDPGRRNYDVLVEFFNLRRPTASGHAAAALAGGIWRVHFSSAPDPFRTNARAQIRFKSRIGPHSLGSTFPINDGGSARANRTSSQTKSAGGQGLVRQPAGSSALSAPGIGH
jgi:hypothetical protein